MTFLYFQNPRFWGKVRNSEHRLFQILTDGTKSMGIFLYLFGNGQNSEHGHLDFGVTDGTRCVDVFRFFGGNGRDSRTFLEVWVMNGTQSMDIP